MSKYQRCNPFLRVLNDNVPLILLLQVLKKLDANPEFNDHNGKPKGISRKELPLVIFWKNNDAEALYQRIVKLRKDYSYNPSDEVICDICTEEIMGGNFKKFKPKSIISEYPDEFIRKMRITGLISLRGAGRFIDINTLEQKRVDYVIKTYSVYRHYTDANEYFKYVSTLDNNLFEIKSETVTSSKREELLTTWLNVYKWDKIKTELQLLERRSKSSDTVLKFIPAPARLEFLTALGIKSKLSSVRVIPNYSCDDTGLPTSTAGGDKSDIECSENNDGVIVEVTMAEGRTQTSMKVWPIQRHLEDFTKNKYKSSSSRTEAIFVAPSIFIDTTRQIKFVRNFDREIIRPYTISQFVKYLECEDHLKSRVLATAESDDDVMNLINDKLATIPTSFLARLMEDLLKDFSERYPDMKQQDWEEIIKSYLISRAT